MNKKLTILEEFKNLLIPLTEEEYNNLEQSVLVEGIRDPLIVWDRVLIDGHHRYLLAQKYNLEFTVKELVFENKNAVIEWIIKNQLGRRNLNESQRALLGARLVKTTHGGDRKSKNQEANSPLDLNQTAEIVNVSARSIKSAKKVLINADTETIKAIEKGELSLHAAEKEIKDIEKQEKKELQQIKDSKYKVISIDNVYHSRFQDSDIESNSIDCIITDPPYPREFLPLWSDLSLFASRVLKPSGFCICYSGQIHLPEVINRMTEHLDYYWQCILLHTGHLAGVYPVRMNVGYKPILIFQKPPYSPQEDFIKDVIIGAGREKDDYEWQQAVNELTHLIEGFTKVGDIILDPMAGTGTVGLACYKNNRNFILIEENEDRINIIKRRLSSDLQLKRPEL